MRRRNFIKLIGAGAAAWPFAVRAQQPARPVVAFLSGGVPRASVEMTSAFRLGLDQAGYTEGNVVLESHWGWGHDDQLPELAADLVRRRVAVIATADVPAALAATVATTAIPTVFTIEGDPVASGLVPTVNRPAGNVTGVAILKAEFVPKRLELLHQVSPTVSTVGLLLNPTNPDHGQPLLRDAQAAASTLGLQLHVLKASGDGELAALFASWSGLQIGGLVIASDQFFSSRAGRIADWALQDSVPAIYQYRAFSAAGGLISYGSNLVDPFQLAGVYTGRILNGGTPADLPIQQSTKVDLLLNLKTAKALSITIPRALLGRADEVRE